MSEHTPGPWYWKAGTPVVYCNWTPDEQVKLAEVVKPAWHEDRASASKEAAANARLIAAAPDLLAALQGILAITDRDHVAWNAAWDAIKKATDE